MFLPWSVFVINAGLTAFQFLLMGALGALISIYSRYGGSYANSIRWIRQSGYVEMMSTFYNSVSRVPTSTTFVLLAVIIATIATSLVHNGASLFIHLSQEPHDVHTSLLNASLSPTFLALGWRDYPLFSAVHYPGSEVSDVIMSTINNTNLIPDADPARKYIPKTFSYETECYQVTIGRMLEWYTNMTVPRDGCAILAVRIHGDYSFNTQKQKAALTIDGNRISIVVPIVRTASNSNEMPYDISVNLGNGTLGYCQITDSELRYANNEGLSSWPRTTVSKCISKDGRILALAATAFRFHVQNISDFNNSVRQTLGIWTRPFEDMQLSINNGTLSNNTVVTHARLLGNQTLLLVCHGDEGIEGATASVCMYLIISSVFTSPQEWSESTKPFLEDTSDQGSVNYLRITHPTPLGVDNGVRFSAASLQNASLIAAQTLTNLGQNFLISYHKERLYVAYDSIALQPGFEVPIWLLVVVVGGMVISVALWVVTFWLLPQEYTNSLYWSVAKEVSPQTGGYTPVLLKASAMPLVVEGSTIAQSQLVLGSPDDSATPLILRNLTLKSKGLNDAPSRL
ncbi:hypothetical protein BGW38_000115 [Lunasporangiospora selenospora]|uniref:Uncharacterized protein n=1 Tax=Lunasporangiospora selenospora TaxID=979761 RepID=A0A9P6FW45_9FUNG|nr:hypothetical protein BGW38_000115 [Lunasporangiospora selenospora]